MQSTGERVPSGEATSESPEDLVRKVSSDLLQCQSYAGLYFREHPRVVSLTEEIAGRLSRFEELTGGPLAFDAARVLEDAALLGTEDHATPELRLARLLESRLIEKIVLPARTSADEIFRFSALLREDVQNRGEESRLSLGAETWPHLEIYCFEVRDIPLGTAAEGDSHSGRLVIHDQALENLIAACPEPVRSSIIESLHDPETIARLSDIAETMRARVGRSAGAKDHQVNLLCEIISASLDRARSADGGDIEPQAVVGNVRDLIGFIESNIGSVARRTSARAGSADASPLSEKIAALSEHHSSFSREAEALQEQKRQLAAIFQSYRSASDEDSTHLGSDGAASKLDARQILDAVKREGKTCAEKKPGVDPTAELEAIRYDIEEIRQGLDGMDAHAPLACVYLDLLEREETRESALGRHAAVVGILLEARENESSYRRLIWDIAHCARSSSSKHGEELLIALLERSESPEALAASLEAIALPGNDDPVLLHLLHEIVERKRAQAIPLLSLLCCGSHHGLRRTARERLIALSKNPVLLAQWIRTDMECFLNEESYRRVHQLLGARRLAGSLREFLSDAPIEETSRFLEGVRPDWPGAEEILLAALEHGSPELRRYTLGTLHRVPSPVVITTLIETVKLNNYRDKLDAGEAEAAISSLLEIDTPRTREFLEEIRSGRDWLRRPYSKEIRQVLARLTAHGKETG
ncbi:MAG: hypothetical protein JXA90_02065 [Planctomycetes bacterium]|nr:hypothetical protein [Planctomycetota bacterium]